MSDGPLSPEEVAHRGFGVSFRGFDTAEVRAYLQRVANDLRAGAARERDLHRRLADAEHRAAHPVLEGETLTRALGEEMARILATAQQAANGLKEKAEENAARILRDAHDQAQRIRAQAESILAVRADEAHVEAAAIRQAGESEADGVVERARGEAADLVGQAEESARLLVQDAQAARARVLGELSRRRRLLQTQVEQLRAGRDRLLDAYRLVRSTTDEVADELQRVEREAREAAGAAGQRMAAEPIPEDADELLTAFAPPEPEAAEPDAAPAGSVPEEFKAEVAAALADRAADEAEAAAQAAEAAAVELAGADLPTGPADEVAQVVSTRPGDRRPLRLLRRPKVDDRDVDMVSPPAADEQVRVVATEQEPAPEPGPSAPAAPPLEATADAEPAAELAAEGPAALAAEEVAPDAPLAGEAAAPTGAGVDELFARIRAGRAEAVAKARQVLAGDEEVPSPAAAAGEGGAEIVDLVAAEAATGPDPAGQETLLRRRDTAVEGMESRLARRLKRALQDEQNEVLDRLRSAGADAGPSDVLPSPDDQADRYRQAAADQVAESATAGVAFVVADGTARPEPPDVADVVAELASSLAEPLRRALQRALTGDSSDRTLAFERIGAAYRECKAQRIEGVAGDAVTAAFSRGTLSALPAGRAATWVVDDEGRPCPDCDDNALAGPTPAGEAFPTGQPHPPAHAGCRCLLAPAELTAAVPGAG